MTIKFETSRIKKVQPKTKEEILIPVSLVNSLIEVDKQINAGIPIVTTIESDDGFQDDFVSGGLEDKELKKYFFSYRPKPGSGIEWRLSLTRDEIEQIAHGQKKFLELWRCKNIKCDFKSTDRNDLCENCDYEVVDKEPDEDEVEKQLKFIAKMIK